MRTRWTSTGQARRPGHDAGILHGPHECSPHRRATHCARPRRANTAAAIINGTRPDQQTLLTTLAALPDLIEQMGRAAPTLLVIGRVVSLARDTRLVPTRSIGHRRKPLRRSNSEPGMIRCWPADRRAAPEPQAPTGSTARRCSDIESESVIAPSIAGSPAIAAGISAMAAADPNRAKAAIRAPATAATISEEVRNGPQGDRRRR